MSDATLNQKVNDVYAGRVVRKDLTKSIKDRQMFPYMF